MRECCCPVYGHTVTAAHGTPPTADERPVTAETRQKHGHYHNNSPFHNRPARQPRRHTGGLILSFTVGKTVVRHRVCDAHTARNVYPVHDPVRCIPTHTTTLSELRVKRLTAVHTLDSRTRSPYAGNTRNVPHVHWQGGSWWSH